MVAWAVVVSEFSGENCRCGRTKERKRYFCPICYFALPETYRKRLWIPWARLSQNAICTLYTRCLAELDLLRPKAKELPCADSSMPALPS